MDVAANKKIGKKLKELRKKRGLKQNVVAERLKKPQSYISKLESGEKSLHVYEVFSYADAINTPRGELLGEIELTLTGRKTIAKSIPQIEYATIDLLLPEEDQPKE